MRSLPKPTSVIACAVVCSWTPAWLSAAELLHVSGLFGPGAAIQHGGPAPVFGTAEPGAKVTVTLQGKTAEAVADDHGRWQADLPALVPGGPLTLESKSGTEVRRSSVMVGDVWLVGGSPDLLQKPAGLGDLAADDASPLRMLAMPYRMADTPQPAVQEQRQAVPADGVAPPIVPGFEPFFRSAIGEAAAIESGLLLLGELGCVNRHATGSEQAVQLLPKRGPELNSVGERLRPQWLINYMKSPRAVKPGTTMPDVLAGLPDAERDRTATAIAHFLAATSGLDDGSLPEADKANATEGLKIYQRAGCAVCHGSRAKDAVPLPDQMPLVDLEKKWTPRALDEFLKNPFHLRPSSRMPALPLSDQERRHVVASLLGSLLPFRNEHRDHISFNGRAWLVAANKLPAINSLGPPATTGPVKGFDVVQLAGKRDSFVVQMDGFLHAPSAGTYHFYLSSDDGSRLFIGGRQVVDNDGIHADTERDGEIVLEPGVHPIRIEYFEAGGGETLHLDVTPPRRPRRSAVEYVPPTAADKPLASMTVEDADAAQRAAVTAAVRRLASSPSEAPTTRERAIDHMLTAPNCYARHDRDGRGGAIPAVAATDDDGEPVLKDAVRAVLLTSATQELGDEGRLPPALTGVGGKLAAGFLREVLVEGGRDRGVYMQTLMPKWHAKVVDPLAKLLAEDVKTAVSTPALSGYWPTYP